MDNLDGFVFDDALAEPILHEMGWTVETVSWRDEVVDWAKYRLVILRTTWDYFDFLPEFLAKIEFIASKTPIANPLPIIRWNADKVYLKELESKGIRIVPTSWGQSLQSTTNIRRFFDEFSADELIIKPTISAGACETFRLTKNSDLQPVLDAFSNRPFMVQPFIDSVVNEGEYSIFYFGGKYSHTILKTPKTDDFRVQEEHGGIITAVPRSEELIKISENILSKINEPLLYARVDLVKNEQGEFCLMELELIEPALYLRMDPNAPKRFAEAINEFLTN